MKNKRGISLIVLVITIVVVIILAAAVILSLSGNNPINNARIANLDQTKDGIESSILAYTGKAQSQTLGYYTVTELLTGNREETESYGIIGDKETTNNDDEAIYSIDKTKFEEKIDTLPSTPTANGEWYIDGNGKVYLVYEKKESMPKWMLNKDDEIDDTFLNKFVVIKDGSNISKGSAKEVADNVATYYGATVTNYTANGVSNWKIFHSDEKNIYLISSEFLPIDKIPATKGGKTFSKGTYSKSTSLTPAVEDSNYSDGSKSISSKNPARKWLSSYLDNYESSNQNMRAVAYMLDTTVWNVYKTNKADYAIGGPTVEMLMQSYSKKYNVNFKAEAKDVIGYHLSKDGGSSWSDYCSLMLNENDTLYVLGSGTNSGANALWLASPSTITAEHLIPIDYYGSACYYDYNNGDVGFRAVVCLKSNVEIQRNDDGSVSLK